MKRSRASPRFRAQPSYLGKPACKDARQDRQRQTNQNPDNCEIHTHQRKLPSEDFHKTQKRPGGNVGDENSDLDSGGPEGEDNREHYQRFTGRQRACSGGDDQTAQTGPFAQQGCDLILDNQLLDQSPDQETAC
ncbi:MAG: hypothetical protein AAGL92_06225, partial [Pseudomonadota bacterium]